MITPQHLLNAIGNEVRILKHLASKLTAAQKDFRFSAEQRSTEELEQYIVASFPVQVKLMVDGVWNEEVYNEYANKFTGFTFDQFAAELDKGLVFVTEQINSLTDAQWQEEVSIRGMTGQRTRFLNDYILTFLGAYKMQLFLQLKAAGLTDLTTYNLWAGMDAPQK